MAITGGRRRQTGVATLGLVCRASGAAQLSAAGPPSGRPRPPDGGRADRLQGALAEPLGVALTRFRKRDDALRKHCTNGVVTVGGGSERGQRQLKAIPI